MRVFHYFSISTSYFTKPISICVTNNIARLFENQFLNISSWILFFDRIPEIYLIFFYLSQSACVKHELYYTRYTVYILNRLSSKNHWKHTVKVVGYISNSNIMVRHITTCDEGLKRFNQVVYCKL